MQKKSQSYGHCPYGGGGRGGGKVAGFKIEIVCIVQINSNNNLIFDTINKYNVISEKEHSVLYVSFN